MRMIDADEAIKRGNSEFGCVLDAVMLKEFLNNQPTIDPETLPIVQELRQQLLDAEAELEIYKIRCQDRKHYDYDLSNIGKAVF